MTILERFRAGGGPTQAADTAMRRQGVLRECESLASKLLALGTIEHIGTHETLVAEGAVDTEVYFLLAGRVRVQVKGNFVGERYAGEMIGEIASLKPSNMRSATVVALEDCVFLKIASSDLLLVTGDCAIFWRNVAEILSDRLEGRNRSLPQKDVGTRLLLVSSSEAKHVYDELVSNSRHDPSMTVVVWKDIFQISSHPITDLVAEVRRADYVVAVMRCDDRLVSRWRCSYVPRDNVVLEYGIALGCLGAERSIILRPRGKNLKLPSDSEGLTYVDYEEKSLKNSIENAYARIKKHIENQANIGR